MGDSAVAPAVTVPVEKTEKEKMLDEKMAAMRKKNEEIQRRHDEVEADKVNANLLSRMAGLSPKSPSPEKEVKLSHKSEAKVNRGRGKPKLQVPSQPNPIGVGQINPAKTRYSGDGPPPDPKFGFLTDPARFSDDTDGGEHNKSPRDPQTNGHNRRHRDGRQPQQSGFSQNQRGGGGHRGNYQPDEAKLSAKERRDYAQWKEEREQIDRERLARAQNASGQWRREWDLEKSADEIERERVAAAESLRRKNQPAVGQQQQSEGPVDGDRQRRKSQPRSFDNYKSTADGNGRGQRRRSEGPEDQNVVGERKIRSPAAKQHQKSPQLTPDKKKSSEAEGVKTAAKRQRRKKVPLENVRVTVSAEGERQIAADKSDKNAADWEDVEDFEDSQWEEDSAMYGASVIGNDLDDQILAEKLSSPAAVLLMDNHLPEALLTTPNGVNDGSFDPQSLPVTQRYSLGVPESFDDSNRDSLDDIEREMIAKLDENIQATEALFDKNDEELELLYGIKPIRLATEETQVRLVLESLINSVELNCP